MADLPSQLTRRLGTRTYRTDAVRAAHGEDCSKFRSSEARDGTSSAAEQMRGLVRSSRSVEAAQVRPSLLCRLARQLHNFLRRFPQIVGHLQLEAGLGQ
jgi:hypothetical protein